MALKGSLDDISIIELLQFPYAGRKTGRLDVTDRQGHTATTYYREGKLIHAVSGGREPVEAIVDLVGWMHGDFIFHPDLQSDRATIDLDLHRLLMQALKMRDERNIVVEKRFQALRRTPAGAPVTDSVKQIGQRLNEAGGKWEALNYVAIISRENHLIAETSTGGRGQDFAQLRGAMLDCLNALKSTSPGRILSDSESGAAILATLDSQRLLFVVARRGEALGAAAAAARRLAAILLKP